MSTSSTRSTDPATLQRFAALIDAIDTSLAKSTDRLEAAESVTRQLRNTVGIEDAALAFGDVRIGSRADAAVDGREIERAPTRWIRRVESIFDGPDASRLQLELTVGVNADTVSIELGDDMVDAIFALAKQTLVRLRLCETEQRHDRDCQLFSDLLRPGTSSHKLHRIAVELSEVLDVDGLALLRRRTPSGLFRFVASSVQSDIDPRSEEVIAVERMINELDWNAGPMQAELQCFDAHPRENENAPPNAVDAFMRSRSIKCCVLCKFVCEADANEMIDFVAFGQVAQRTRRAHTALSSEHHELIGRAIGFADRAQSKSIAGRARKILDSRMNRLRWASLIALVLLLLFVPVTVRVSGQGRLVPQSQQFVIAPITGQLDFVSCRDGQQVERGETLCRFSSYDLDLKLTQTRGALLTVQEQLQIAATRRADSGAAGIASDRAVLEVRQTELQKELDLLVARQESLTVTSPIAGTVDLLLDDAEQDLIADGHPVAIGQPVLRIINAEAGYHVMLDLPDDEIGYAIRAWENHQSETGQPGLPCEYRLRSQPEIEHSGRVTSIAAAASLDALGRRVVTVTVDPDTKASDFTAETGVSGEVACETASLGFVLTRKLIEQFRWWGWM